jgi:predicted dehydrogenase
MKKYNALIIGAGGQGALADAPGSPSQNKIISFAKALKEHPGFELAGIVDKNHDAADKARQIWGIKWWCVGEGSHSYFFDNYTPTLPISIVVVATPDDTHYEILKDLAEYPLKLVICEKPLCNNLQQAREIVALYKTKGIPLAVNYTRRFLPYYEDLKRRHEAGEFGKIVSANIVFNRGWEHTATHAIDLCEWLFNGQYNGKIMECETDYRIWQIDLFFEKHHWREERIGDMPVPAYFDKHTWHVAENAYNFLEGREPLKCTGEDALKSLEICFELMDNN